MAAVVNYEKDMKRLQVHKQTRLCRFFVVGACTRGEACAFAHGKEKLKQQPDFSKTRLCADFVELGSCMEGDRCSGLLKVMLTLYLVVFCSEEIPRAGRSEHVRAKTRPLQPRMQVCAWQVRAAPRISAQNWSTIQEGDQRYSKEATGGQGLRIHQSGTNYPAPTLLAFPGCIEALDGFGQPCAI